MNTVKTKNKEREADVTEFRLNAVTPTSEIFLLNSVHEWLNTPYYQQLGRALIFPWLSMNTLIYWGHCLD